MIKAVITGNMIKRISSIEQNRFSVSTVELPTVIAAKLRKNSKKKSSYASNKIEGNPLTLAQADAAIEADAHRHFLKPEQEIRNYYLALDFLEKQIKNKTPFSKELILKVQSLVEKGASKEKTGLRGAVQPGFLFAVYDSETGNSDYIPPEYSEIPALLDELVEYVRSSDDHPLIIAAIVHYQLVTIHPFEDGNGRTARLMSGYIMELLGYGFNGIGSLEEYFAYDSDEYYRCLQMDLPALYYSGRNNPPHPEIWLDYFLHMVELYSSRVCEISKESGTDGIYSSLSHLSLKEKQFLKFLIENHLYEFAPVDVGKMLGVTNKTVINRCASLSSNGFLLPVIVKERIRSYKLTDFTKSNSDIILSTGI